MNIISRKEAKENNMVYYFTGKPCKNGHVATRQVSNSACTECHRERNRKFAKAKYNNDPEHADNVKLYQKRYRDVDPIRYKNMLLNRPGYNDDYMESQRQRSKQHYYDNREKYTQYMKWYFSQNYVDGNRYKSSLIANNAKRRAALRNAIPRWVELSEVKKMYQQARTKTINEGVEYHVDHIIPLQNELVCGLHCLDNLQIITATENQKKHNKLQCAEKDNE